MSVKTKAIKQRLIASPDAARMLGVGPATFRARVLAGVAPEPFVQQGNMYYYKLADVEYFCEFGRWPESVRYRDRASAAR